MVLYMLGLLFAFGFAIGAAYVLVREIESYQWNYGVSRKTLSHWKFDTFQGSARLYQDEDGNQLVMWASKADYNYLRRKRLK